MSIIFGPINSRRFGLSLGIDLSPKQKSCNFDCLYCELEPAKPTNTIANPPKVDDIILQTQEALQKFKDIEVITITANGEPTLYADLKELINRLNQIKRDKKLLILSNASRIFEKEVQEALQKLDIVKLSLDCVSHRCFKRLDRPLKSISIEKIVRGIEEFRKTFQGLLVIEVLVVKGVNDKEEEFAKLAQVLKQIRADRIDIGTIDRPPAYKVEPISYERLFELSKELQSLNVNIVARKNEANKNLYLSAKEILDLLSHRPLTKEDITTLFDSSTQKVFAQMLQKKQIIQTQVGKVAFYLPAKGTNALPQVKPPPNASKSIKSP